MLSLIWFVLKTHELVRLHCLHRSREDRSPECIITFICRYASYTDSIDSLSKSNNIHIPPDGRKISTSRIKSVRLPNQRLIYIWYSLQSWVEKRYLLLASTHQRQRLYRRKLKSNSSWSIKVSITKIASLAVTSLTIPFICSIFLLIHHYFSVFLSKNVFFPWKILYFHWHLTEMT